MKALIPIVLLAAGCVAPAESQNETAGNEGAVPGLQGNCDAAKAQSLVGRQRSEELGQEAQRLTGATRLRWMGPGQAVTMDYSPSRLNIVYDEGDKVTEIRCG